MDKLSISW